MDEPSESDPLRTVRARRRRPRHTLRRVVLWIVGVLVLLVLLSAGAGVATVALFLKDPSRFVGCDLASERPRARGEKSFMYARDATPLGAVPSTWNREPIRLSRMGRWLPKATVAIEDRRFWERERAVDYEAIVRAAVANVRARRTVQGGSTIQQQLVRDRYLRHPKLELSRKLTEACLAIELGRRMTKREILQTYLNGAFYGSNAYGVEAAAQTYFSRPARKLALVQAAMVAGLPQAPSRFDPARHPAAAKRRRNQVLAALRDAGDITPRRYAAARRHPLRLTPTRRYRSLRYPAFFEAARRELVDRYGLRRARRGGLRVKTTVDPHLQRLAEGALSAWLRPADRPRGCARRDRPGDRGGARHGRARAGRPPAPVQPRHAVAPPGRQHVQGLHAGGGDGGRHPARLGLARSRHAADLGPAVPDRRRALGRQQLRRRGPGDDDAPAGHRPLGEHDLCAGRVARRALEGGRCGAPDGDRVAAPARVLAHPRPGGRVPARDDRRLRDAGGARHPPSPRAAPARYRAERQGRASPSPQGAPGAVARRRGPGDLRTQRRGARRNGHRRLLRAAGGGQDRHR